MEARRTIAQPTSALDVRAFLQYPGRRVVSDDIVDAAWREGYGSVHCGGDVVIPIGPQTTPNEKMARRPSRNRVHQVRTGMGIAELGVSGQSLNRGRKRGNQILPLAASENSLSFHLTIDQRATQKA